MRDVTPGREAHSIILRQYTGADDGIRKMGVWTDESRWKEMLTSILNLQDILYDEDEGWIRAYDESEWNKWFLKILCTFPTLRRTQAEYGSEIEHVWCRQGVIECPSPIPGEEAPM